jgi:glutamate/tyrosine decarboxylase-like PLP-dependent enzyme
MISQDMELARHLHSLADEHPELEAMARGLSVSVFRYVPESLKGRAGEPEVVEYLNSLNREIQDRMERGGEAFISGAVIHGEYGLRACIVNFNTTRTDVEALPSIVTRVGREVHSENSGKLVAS